MSCSYNTSLFPKALPSLHRLHGKPKFSVFIKSSSEKQSQKPSSIPQKVWKGVDLKALETFVSSKSSLAIQVGAFLATGGAEPALAVTGENNEDDLIWVLIQLAISAFFYFLVCPPIIMNWLRKRWYKRDLLEMYLQFMFVFMFFPGLLLWAPFLNFRKFPRDPSMKYPWSTPENPSQIKNDYRKYPWATEEDYEVP